jgi:sulfatase-like protein
LMSGTWRPTPEDFEFLHLLYRETFRILDRRVQSIVRSLMSSGRWNDTMLIVTSDHGQAFGEHGFLFHEFRVWEPILRIPLFIRYPRSRGAGAVGRGWASLVDIAPTVLESAGVSHTRFGSAYSLKDLIDFLRPEPVWAISDGASNRKVIESACGSGPAEYWDRVLVAGYSGSTKVITDINDQRTEAYDVVLDQGESSDRFAQLTDKELKLSRGAVERGSRFLADCRGSSSPTVDEHLRGWGYL